MISTGDAEFPRDYHTLAAGGNRGARRFPDNNNGGFTSSSLDRRHNSVAAKSLEALNSIHKADIERQRDSLMDLQKSKFSNSPGSVSQGSAPAGRQQQPNYWSFKTRTPRVTRLSPTQPALADQASRVSFASAENLGTMSEPDIPIGFNRMNRLRQSLPLARTSSQAKLRAPGILFLQLGEETRRVHLTHELTSLETLRALIVHMFPQRLTMAMLRSPNTALLIKDETRNVFYELEDPRDIQDRCVIKIYCKEPIYGTYPGHQHPHLANGDLRREMVYAPQDSPPNRRLSNPPMSSQHSSCSASPQGSPSRARLLYSGARPSSYAGPPHHTHSLPHPHSQSQSQSQSHHSSPHQQPQLHQPHHTQQAFCSSSSAILERRDVKPDDEVGGSRSMVLLRGEERGGGGIYADPYSLGPDTSRLSLAGGPHSPLPARADPYGSLYRRGGGGGGGAGSMRSLTSYTAAALQGELMESGALYRPGGPLYNDAYAASMLAMGLRVPPPSSPQKIPDMRESYAGTMPGRGSPGRQSLRRDSVASSVFGDSPKARGQGSGLGLTSEQLCLMAGTGGEGGSAGGFGSPLLGNETETRERMEAMEKQIASLTGLLQRVLSRAPEAESPEKIESASDCSGTDTLTPSAPLALMPPPPSGPNQPVTVSRLQMQLHLQGLQQNTNALRKQLSQLRNIQLENQDSVLSLLRQTESELSLMMLDAMRTQEDPLQRQRLLVEEERLKYLNQEELLIQQLHDLEKSVEELQRNSSVNHGLVTEQDVEQKSKELRKLGETLTELKNQFPSLQSKMRVVLRVEVEAVKFLKEEPHRLDALLKRCNTMTDALSMLRSLLYPSYMYRQVTEGVWKGPEDLSSQSLKRTEDMSRSSDLDILNSPPLSLSDLSTSSSLANWMPVSAGDSDTSGPEQDIQPSMTFRNRVLDELPSRRPGDKSVSAEVRLAAERDWEEKRASLTQFSAQDINRLLEETQAELMKAIPDLDFAARHINKPAVPPKPQITIPITSSAATSPAAGTIGTTAATASTTTPSGDQQPGKVQLAAQKLNSLEGAGSHRGSVDLSMTRYRTEKPSKSPPPPPPRRSFPSAHGLTTNRTGEVIVTAKNMKMEEDGDMAKTLVKLRRTPSDTPRPASTPPVIAASAIQDDDDDEEKIIAELEVFQRTPVKDCNKLHSTQPKAAPIPPCIFGSLGRKNSTNSPGPTKGPTVAARLKHLQQGSLERPKSRKQKEDFPKVQGQQQVFHF
ncbi:SRC kinase signaling inhibitor 1 isoform X1 [Perca flavescens]|uniref:SRC kinase signaling inhibitor 1 isoform X1 n=1 Tax=Perca flavescens TaxID=8167 RepID=UPI00106E0FD1|nr:SRC kinase signaling inhibitor 1-like isoform X1 [Perca flavescens]XP_028423086.1 SRC kinase signaling inhibitor 1-like isoform X1 [Perca flavescens]